jgi:hypothetical protein
VIRQLCTRAVEQTRPDFGCREGHAAAWGTWISEGGRSYPPPVDKSTLVDANQCAVRREPVDLTFGPNYV